MGPISRTSEGQKNILGNHCLPPNVKQGRVENRKNWNVQRGLVAEVCNAWEFGLEFNFKPEAPCNHFSVRVFSSHLGVFSTAPRNQHLWHWPVPSDCNCQELWGKPACLVPSLMAELYEKKEPPASAGQRYSFPTIRHVM